MTFSLFAFFLISIVLTITLTVVVAVKPVKATIHNAFDQRRYDKLVVNGGEKISRPVPSQQPPAQEVEVQADTAGSLRITPQSAAGKDGSGDPQFFATTTYYADNSTIHSSGGYLLNTCLVQPNSYTGMFCVIDSQTTETITITCTNYATTSCTSILTIESQTYLVNEYVADDVSCYRGTSSNDDYGIYDTVTRYYRVHRQILLSTQPYMSSGTGTVLSFYNSLKDCNKGPAAGTYLSQSFTAMYSCQLGNLDPLGCVPKNESMSIVDPDTTSITYYENAHCSTKTETIAQTMYGVYGTCQYDESSGYYYLSTLQASENDPESVTLSAIQYGGLITAIPIAFVFGAFVVGWIGYNGLLPVKSLEAAKQEGQ